MPGQTSRREFLHATAAGGLAIAGAAATNKTAIAAEAAVATPSFRISLAEWSLHRALFAGKLENLDFPRVARQEFDIDAVEYVNAFFKERARDDGYLTELKSRCDGEGVQSLLIMCDGEGKLGDPDAKKRGQAVRNHHKWVDAAKRLGCHSIRVNAASSGSFDEQQKLAADGLAKLGEYAESQELNVVVENHGGLSSNGAWLAAVMKLVGRPNVGTLPDFGNFRIRGGRQAPPAQQEWYDKYLGVAELMPFAKAVSAKSYAFDGEGNETTIDYFKMMKIVLEAGYSGYVGIEWEGDAPSEYEGVRQTKRLLERVRVGLV